MRALAGAYLGLFYLLSACSGSGGGATGALRTVQGIDKTGIWEAYSVLCVTADHSNINHESAITTGYSYSVSIDGNLFNETIVSGSCEVKIVGNITFHSANSISITNRKVTSVTGGACTTTSAAADNTISINPSNLTYTTNQEFPDQTTVYYESGTSPATGFPNVFYPASDYSDGSGGECFIQLLDYH